jgi:hypothetical protein
MALKPQSKRGLTGLNHAGDIIAGCWKRSTSYDPEGWTAVNRAWGQCAVTALVVQDLFGGVVLRGLVNGIEHYWNRLPNELEVDLTRGQFSEIHEESAVIQVSRESILASDWTTRRYQELRRRVMKKVVVPGSCSGQVVSQSRERLLEAEHSDRCG